jgi:hypothetical protein
MAGFAVLASTPWLSADARARAVLPDLPPEESARFFAHEWLKLLGELTALAGLSPPAGARAYAYAALTEYELWAALGYDRSILGEMESPPLATRVPQRSWNPADVGLR